MMTTKERNDRMQMIKKEHGTRFFFEISDNTTDELKKVKDILEDVEAKTSLIRDALIYYVNSDEFDLGRYEGPGHRCDK